jgi:hypothetical protein
VRTTLIGLLITGVTPITTADATVLINRQAAILPAQPLANTIGLSALCSLSDSSIICPSSTFVNQPEVNSDHWLQTMTNIFLSGSMFTKCSEQFPDSQLNTFTSDGCVFSWQKWLNQKIPDQQTVIPSKKLVSSEQSSTKSSSSLPVSSVTQFPKLSRSSLIIPFPKEDSSFIPTNTKLANPVPETNRIGSNFGWRTRPYSNQLQFHEGIDYVASLGSRVVAVDEGIVTRVVSGCIDFSDLYCGGQMGNWVEIDHGNGAIAMYGHLKNSSITVKEGMKVSKNQEIAQVGSSGWSTGAHLHFGIQVNGQKQDPAKFLASPPGF